MYCKYCGSVLEPESSFCGSCGKSLVQPASPKEPAIESIPTLAADSPASAGPSPAGPSPVGPSHVGQPPLAGPILTAPSRPVKPFGKPILFGAAAVLIALIIILVKSLGGGSQSSPAAAVKGFIQAADKHDIDAMVKYAPPDKRPSAEELKLTKSMLKSYLKESKFDIVDYKILKVEKEGDEATVRYMIQTSEDGEKQASHEQSFDLIKIGKKWYIKNDILNF